MNPPPTNPPSPLRKLTPYQSSLTPQPAASAALAKPTARVLWGDKPMIVAEVPPDILAKVQNEARAAVSSSSSPASRSLAAPSTQSGKSTIANLDGPPKSADARAPSLSPPAAVPAGMNWWQDIAQTPFPVGVLPPWLAEYVGCLAAHFLLQPEAVAPLVLAQLAGVLAEHRSVRSQTGATVSLPFSVIVAAEGTPALSMALVESGKALADLQQKHLDIAAGFDRRRAEELMQTVCGLLPDDALPAREVEPREVDSWRARLVRLRQQPLFWLESPGAKDLSMGFSSSFDRTLLVSFSRGGCLEKLVAPKRDREANRLGDLLARLVRGSHITVSCSPRNPAAPRVVQGRFGLVGLTASNTLTQALKDEREDVCALLGHSVLLDLAQASNMAATRPTPERLQKAGSAWRQFVASLLTERRAAESGSHAPHACFHATLTVWQGRLHAVSQQTPASLRGHLAAFVDLPLKLGSLLLAVGEYGVWKDAEAARAALQIAEWMLGRTLLCAASAQEDHRRRVLVDAREKMFAKIVELGPIAFWRLCRHFDRQSKALHEPTLHALLDEKRVCVNPDGKFVAT